MLQRHQGDRDKLIVALTKLRNDETKLEADGEGLNSMVQLLMQASLISSRGRCEQHRRPPPARPLQPLAHHSSACAAADVGPAVCLLPAGGQ